MSGTRISGSYRCLRQAVIEERFGGFSGDKAVLGTLMHELVQVLEESVHAALVGLHCHCSLHQHCCLDFPICCQPVGPCWDMSQAHLLREATLP